jgi:enoyl-CoA hydratase
MAYENIRLDWEGAIARVTVDRPKALNALNSRTLEELRHAFEAARAAPQTRALIVTGAGPKAFVAGADISEMVAFTAEQGRTFSEIGHRAFSLLEALPFPTIAAINGFALGGGLELALGCDLLYASETAKLGFPETGLGVIPGFGGTQRLTRRVGLMRAKELVFTGQTLDAAQAKAVGLVLDVLAPDRLLPHCMELAQKMAGRGPLALAQAKRVMESGAHQDLSSANGLEQQAFGALFATEDLHEGMKAFLEKRGALFQGR